jgi:hypothetical protein
MRQKHLNLAIIIMLTGSMSISCSEDVKDCPTKMCLIVGTWQLTEAYVDGVKDDGDLTNYRLVLYMPQPVTATSAEYKRIQPSGISELGVWSIENNGTILRLVPNGNPASLEDWIIDKMEPEKMILIMHRDTGIKDGPSEIEFVLEPV